MVDDDFWAIVEDSLRDMLVHEFEFDESVQLSEALEDFMHKLLKAPRDV